jgi:hypothetical protein
MEAQIKLLQDLYHTYKMYNASEQVLQMTMERLLQLQESAK